MRFLFIYPPSDKEMFNKNYTFKDYIPPLGLLYIATPLKRNNHQITLFDFNIEKFEEKKIITELRKTDAVCISVLSSSLKSASKIVDLIKKFDPDLPVLIGGVHCTIQGKKVLKEINADICVIGEGEKVILEIAESLKNNLSLSRINGVIYRENNQIKKGLPPTEINNIDEIDFPSRELIKKYNYREQSKTGITSFAEGRVTSISTSRGCPFNCSFCVSKKIFKKYRVRSAYNVVKELEEIEKDFDSVFIVDDNFLFDKKRANKIFNLIIKNKMDLDIWIGGVRVDDADEKLFKKMKRANVKMLEFGIESGNQKVLEYYNKKTDLKQIEKAIKLSKKTGFLTIGYFMVGSPIEKNKNIKDTIKFAKKINPDIASFFPFKILKGSKIWDEACKIKKIDENQITVNPTLENGLGNFTSEQLNRIVSKAYRSFYLNPKYILSAFFRQIIVFKNFKIFRYLSKILIK